MEHNSNVNNSNSSHARNSSSVQVDKDDSINWNLKRKAESSEPVLNRPDQVYKSKPRSVSVEKLYRDWMRHEQNTGTLIEHSTALYQQVDSILTKTINQAAIITKRSINRADFSFDIIRSPEINAFIIHGDGFKPHICITTALLTKLHQRYGELRAGHLAFILGHELNHFLKGHYYSENTVDSYRSSNDPLPYEQVGLLKAKHQLESMLLSRAFTRAQEYECDEFGVRVCHELGLPTGDCIEVLRYLSELDEKSKKERSDSRAKKRYALSSWAVTNILSTHPPSETRTFRAQGAARNYQVLDFGCDLKKEKKLNTIIKIEEATLTLAQETIKKLEGTLSLSASKRAVEILQIANEVVVANASNNERLVALKSLYYLAPLFLDVASQILPAQLFSVITEPSLDRPLQSRNDLNYLTLQLLNKIEAQIRRLSSCTEIESLVEGSILRLAHGGLREREQLAHDLIDSIDNEQTIEVINAVLSRSIIDLEFGHSAKRVLNLLAQGPLATNEHLQFYAQLASTGVVDVRGDLIRILLEDGILERIDSERDILLVVNLVEKSFFDSPDELDRIAPVLGQALYEWINFKWPENSPVSISEKEVFARKVLERTRLNPKEVDLLAIELLQAQIDLSERATYSSKLAWIKKTIPPSKTRDLLLMRMLEEESGWFYSSMMCGSKRLQVELYEKPDFRLFIMHNENEKTEEFITMEDRYNKFIKDFEKIALLLDLTWLDPRILRGSLVDTEAGFDRELKLYNLKSFSNRDDAIGLSAVLCKFAATRSTGIVCNQDHAANEIRFYLASFLDCCFGDIARQEYKGCNVKRAKALFKGLLKSNENVLLLSCENAFAVSFSFEFDQILQSKYRNPIAREVIVRALISSQNKLPGVEINAFNLIGAFELFSSFPAGEFRDILILQTLAAAIQYVVANERIEFNNAQNNPEQIKAMFGSAYVDLCARLARAKTKTEYSEQAPKATSDLSVANEYLAALSELRSIKNLSFAEDRMPVVVENKRKGGQGLKIHRVSGWKEIVDNRDIFRDNFKRCLGLLNITKDESVEKVSIPIDRLERFEAVRRIYSSYREFLLTKAGLGEVFLNRNEKNISFPELSSIISELGRVMYEQYIRWDEIAGKPQMSVEEKLLELKILLPLACEQRDRYLIDILDEALKNKSDLEKKNFYGGKLAEELFNLLGPTHIKYDLGRKIYQVIIETDSSLKTDFTSHLDLLLHLHPQDSISREQALKVFIDKFSITGAVQSWEERDILVCALEKERIQISKSATRLKREGSIMFILEALNEIELPAKERVDTVLWAVGLRPKSHLVNCIELLEGKNISDLKDHSARLSDAEKKELVKLVLAGPKGILTSDDKVARKEFLDTLFFTVFKSNESHSKNNRAFKSIYDCMLYHLSPERAAEFLGNFLVSYLEGKDFNQQIKIFFESFDFIGIKTAQYLVSATTLIPDDLRKVLMDLTSRVEGPHKLGLFDILEQTHGKEIRNVVKHIGRRVGGGSLMSFYEVELYGTRKGEPGKKGVVGILRPDIVLHMPEDLRLVSRIIQTMHEAPELFGGEYVSEDLMDNLAWQSLIETNLQRTARLQELMRANLLGVQGVEIPKLWRNATFINSDGQEQAIELTKGPLIFMDYAPGETLDLFIERHSVINSEGKSVLSEIGAKKMREIATKISAVFFEQIGKHGLVHCDLHPGNILINETPQGIEIKLLDVGLSAELTPRMRELCSRLFRIVVGSTTSGSAITDFIRKAWLGTGQVSEAQGKGWIVEMLAVFESLAGETWSNAQKDNATQVLWQLLNDKTRSPQARIAEITTLCRKLGMKLPREIFYLIRAASITNHLWQYADWKALQPIISKLGQSENGQAIPDVNADKVVKIVDEIHKQITLPNYREAVLRAYLQLANLKSDPLDRIKHLRDMFIDISGKDEEKARQFLRKLAEDKSFREALGLEAVADKVRAVFAELKSTTSQDSNEMIFTRNDNLPDGEAKLIALTERMGSKVRIWDGLLHTGTLLKRTNKLKNTEYFVVECPNPVDINDCNGALIRPIEDQITWRRDENGKLSSHLTDSEINKIEAGISLDGLLSEAEEIALAYDIILEEGELYSEVLMAEFYQSQKYYNSIDLKQKESLERAIVETIQKKSVEAFKMAELLLSINIPRTDVSKYWNLGEMIRDSEAGELQVLVKGHWIPISKRFIQEGESVTEYYKALSDERVRLGLESEVSA